jgi:cellulose synthase/poly-beta-1,6-N-acetylglucosamine synthase-like glycosyltransferase
MLQSNIKLSIIIPCYNEENYIKSLLQELLEKIDPFEIIIVDDNSSDKSIEIIESFNQEKIILLKNDTNGGKGYSLKRGFDKAFSCPHQPHDLHFKPPGIKGQPDSIGRDKQCNQ